MSSGVWLPPGGMAVPRLGGRSGRWASELTMTIDGGSNLGEHMSRANEIEFPPPPPPPLCRNEDSAKAQARMMHWFQQIELWGMEPSKPDNERLVVAPCPRPPPFVNPTTSLIPVLSVRAPYSFASWVSKCRRWWAYVTTHFAHLQKEFRILDGVSVAPLCWSSLQLACELEQPDDEAAAVVASTKPPVRASERRHPMKRNVIAMVSFSVEGE